MLRIDLYTEITCPWCIVGHHRLDNVLAKRFSELPVRIVQHPVLLVPDAPTDGLHIPDVLRARYGWSDPRPAFDRIETEARAAGFTLELGRLEWVYPTQAAHALVLSAEEEFQHRLAVAITDAYFLKRKKISDPDVLADIAVEFGFMRERAKEIALDPKQHRRVEREAARSAQDGVRSVPTFVFDRDVVINGGRSEDEIAAAISAALKRAA